ncbi:MAG: MBL fold metallo-hydrolase [Limnobacter sp.]|nr:MBL fold metallo-hydrolase [Limnobacter sp.]
MKLRFAGAADTVTGSRHLLDTGQALILVDCGLFQGFKKLRDRNWQPFPVPPREIDEVVLTHAHLDHSGWLPVLARQGFRGRVRATRGTAELCAILLRDSARLQEEEAGHANRHGWSKHSPAQPLYTLRDAELALSLIETESFNTAFDLPGGLRGELLPAGHLLGAAIVRMRSKRRSIVFSGDLGRSADPVMRPPRTVESADVLVVESTYGDRRHVEEDSEAIMARVIRDTAAAGGTVLIPSFAIGRAQLMLYTIWRLQQRGEIPGLPVFLDSPMAIDATRLYQRFRRYHRLSDEETAGMCQVAMLANTPEQSKAIARLRMPSIIVAASGMATGGRVLHHLKRLAPVPENHLLFAGFQAGGTRGAHIVGGAREVKIHGEWHPVRAQVTQLEGFSGHADSEELMAWMAAIRRPPKQVWVVHGEPEAADTLRQRISETFGWPARVPEHLETVEIPF